MGSFIYSSSDPTIASISGSLVTIKSLGTVSITATQVETTNYTTGSITCYLTVNKSDPLLSNFNNLIKTYADNLQFILIDPDSTASESNSFTYSSSDTEIASISGSTVTIVGAGTVTITATRAETATYNSGTITCYLTINKANPTLSIFNNLIKTYGEDAFNLTNPNSLSVGSFIYSSSNPLIASVYGSLVTIKSVGTVTITATQVETINYNSETITCSLTINKANPTLSNFNNLMKIFGDVFNLTNPNSSNPESSFTYSSSNPLIASVSGSLVTINSVGTVIITATQVETSNYNSGSISCFLTANKAEPILNNFNNIVKIYFKYDKFNLTAPTSSNPSSFTYSSSDPSVASVSGDSVTILKTGIVTITATQNATELYNSGIIQCSLKIIKNKINPTLISAGVDLIDNKFKVNTDSDGVLSYSFSDITAATVNSDSTVSFLKPCELFITVNQSETPSFYSGIFSFFIDYNL